MFFLLPNIYVAKTKKMGNGVFTSAPIKAGTIVEVSPVIVMNNEERVLLDQTRLHDYIFEWGDRKKQCCMAMGFVPIYNHSYHSNCEYEMEYKKEIIRITAMRDIKKGEELFINYNGTYNNSSPLWFDAH
jgi:uncharacterized protein